MTTIYEITATRGTDIEQYYEPARLSRSVRQTLRDKGWSVRCRAVDADREIERAAEAEARMSRESARLAGASSATHSYAMMAGISAQRIQDIRGAAAGTGSLTGD